MKRYFSYLFPAPAILLALLRGANGNYHTAGSGLFLIFAVLFLAFWIACLAITCMGIVLLLSKLGAGESKLRLALKTIAAASPGVILWIWLQQAQVSH